MSADPPAVETWPCRGAGAVVPAGDPAHKTLGECPRCKRLFLLRPDRLRIPPHKRPVCGRGDEHGCLCLEPPNHPQSECLFQ